jgi:hypothetical protein
MGASPMPNLRERCVEFLKQYGYSLAQSDWTIEKLREFVVAEIGRNSDETLIDARALVLYFSTDEDRDGFIEAFKEAKPNVRTEKV